MATTTDDAVATGTGFSRRDFLKLSAAAGGMAGMASLLGLGATAEVAHAATTYDTIDDMIPINMDEFERFDQRNVAFMRSRVPTGLIPPEDTDDPELMAKIWGTDPTYTFEPGDPGFTQIDNAFYEGGRATYHTMGASVTGSGMSVESSVNFKTPDGKLVPWNMFAQTSASFPNAGPGWFDVAEKQYEFDNPSHAAYAVKKAAKMFGADLVGIAPYDERWVYRTEVSFPKDMKGEVIPELVDLNKPVDMGFTPKSVIVLAFEMSYEAFKGGAGTTIVTGATMTGYSRMAEVSLRLAVFLRKLGYKTYHCGNNASSSVSEAIRAGLGEPGRLSILITEEYGPRVRLAKVYTDLEFEYDKPKSFGVTEFCEVCQLCADACPTQAIPHISINDPENKPFNKMNMPGVHKYYLNAQRCLLQWFNVDFMNRTGGGGGDCGICIGVCPYNKPEAWHDDVIKIVTGIPGLNSLARYFDGFFGYGGIPDRQTLTDFWRKDV